MFPPGGMQNWGQIIAQGMVPPGEGAYIRTTHNPDGQSKDLTKEQNDAWAACWPLGNAVPMDVPGKTLSEIYDSYTYLAKGAGISPLQGKEQAKEALEILAKLKLVEVLKKG